MATDDEKQVPEPDPWAGLDIGGAEEKGEDFTFSFDGLEDDASPADAADHGPTDPGGDAFAAMHEESPSTDAPAFGGDLSVADDRHDEAEEDIPLAVFPPADAEAAGSEVLIGTGSSGIISMPRAADASGDENGDASGADDDGFDDDDIARELGLAGVDGDAVAEESIGHRDGVDGAADFGDAFAESPSDDVSFDAGMMAGAVPFADSEQVGPAVDAAASWPEDPASIPITAAVAATAAAVSAGPAGGRAPAARKKSGGLGQMVGVVLGGLMALPITYAILIWGFHKDPFKFGRQVPEQLAFLLPQKLQPGYKPPRKATSGPNLDAAPSLDDLPTADDAPAQPAADSDATASAEPADGEPADGEPADGESATSEEMAETEASEGTDDSEPVKSAPMKTEAVASTSTEPSDDAEPATPDDSSKPAAKPADESVAAAVAAAPPMAADTTLAAVSKPDALPGLDAVMADAGVSVVASAPATASAPPPLDLSGVDMAAEQATQAWESLGDVTEPESPDRDRLLVTWYKRIAKLGEELVKLETVAADSGRPLSQTPDSAVELLDRICVSDAAVEDLDRLGGMWLTSQRRRADGVVLVVTLGASRQVGPYWSTRVSVSGGQADGADRSLAVISRSAPPADAGDRMVVSGVMFDGDAVWAADIRPVAPPPSQDAEQE